MITLNEAHNLAGVFQNLEGFADEIILLDSFSSDETVKVARSNGARVYQRAFSGFGDQWNYAVDKLPVKSQWLMKLDPDERLSDELKLSIKHAIVNPNASGFKVSRRLWFMGKPLPVRQQILRIWKTGACKFTNVTVNEHPIVTGKIETLTGYLEHHDSPDLRHWVSKQNTYTSAEAQAKYDGSKLDTKSSLFGDKFARRMWIKKHFSKLPLRHRLVFFYCFFIQGTWRAGRVGYIWARLRADIYRMREYKFLEMKWRRDVEAPPRKVNKISSTHRRGAKA